MITHNALDVKVRLGWFAFGRIQFSFSFGKNDWVPETKTTISITLWIILPIMHCFVRYHVSIFRVSKFLYKCVIVMLTISTISIIFALFIGEGLTIRPIVHALRPYCAGACHCMNAKQEFSSPSLLWGRHVLCKMKSLADDQAADSIS